MIAASIYDLDVIAADIADHDGNQTRFVVVGRDGVPAPTGHDKTSLVVYQRANEPGSLISILQEFAARRINLTAPGEPAHQGRRAGRLLLRHRRSTATSPTSWWPTACATSTPSRAA